MPRSEPQVNILGSEELILIFYTSFQMKRGKVGVILLFFLSLTIGYIRTKSLIII